MNNLIFTYRHVSVVFIGAGRRPDRNGHVESGRGTDLTSANIAPGIVN
jgi:hypothetical protein